MKAVKILTGVLFVICAGLGGYGLYLNINKGITNDYTIDYIYYLDDSEVTTMPGNIGAYDFSNYYCTNGVKGDWNEVEWKFVPSLTDNTTCSIYFNTKTYEVKLDVLNATTEEGFVNTVTVKRDNNVEFNVEPKEGYQFDKVTCTNNEVGTFDETTKKITIGPFTNGASCTVIFKVSEFKIKVESTNSTPGSATATVEYKRNAEIELTPTTNYTLDSITCTNEQKASWANNKLTVTEVVKDTDCTVKFKLQSYKVTVKVIGGTVDTASKTIAYGKSDSFTITPSSTYTLDEPDIKCGTTASGSMDMGKLTVSSVKGITTCTITLQEKTPEPPAGD